MTEHGYASVNGLRICYELHGPDDNDNRAGTGGGRWCWCTAAS